MPHRVKIFEEMQVTLFQPYSRHIYCAAAHKIVGGGGVRKREYTELEQGGQLSLLLSAIEFMGHKRVRFVFYRYCVALSCYFSWRRLFLVTKIAELSMYFIRSTLRNFVVPTLSMVGDPLSGNGCGSPNHVQF